MTLSSSMGSVVRRDRIVVLLCLLAVVALAWVALAVLAWQMDEVAVITAPATGPRFGAWAVVNLVLICVMWGVMMIGMMLPGASPMILMFARINRRQREAYEPFVPTGFFVGGYVAIWWAFSLAAAVLQWGLQGFGLLSPTMASNDSVLAGLVLLAAGLYQWSRLKYACLRHCQTPLAFVMTRWREGKGGAFRMGLGHGAYCLGCCWLLMLLLFVGGVMNLLWIAALAAFVLVEKIIPRRSWLPRIAGAALILWGGQLLSGAV